MTWREEREAGPSDSATDSPAKNPDEKKQIIRIRKNTLDQDQQFCNLQLGVQEYKRGENGRVIKTRVAINVYEIFF